MTKESDTKKPVPGLLVSMQRLLGSFIKILQTRLEIISTELEEEGWRIRQLIIYTLLSLFFLGLGILILTLFVVKAFPDQYQLYVLGAFAVIYLGLGVFIGMAVKENLKARSRLFSATLSELKKDSNDLDS